MLQLISLFHICLVYLFLLLHFQLFCTLLYLRLVIILTIYLGLQFLKNLTFCLLIGHINLLIFIAIIVTLIFTLLSYLVLSAVFLVFLFFPLPWFPLVYILLCWFECHNRIIIVVVVALAHYDPYLRSFFLTMSNIYKYLYPPHEQELKCLLIF